MRVGNLIAGEKLIYERVDDVVYARYRDSPYKAVSYTHLTLPTNREV